VKRQKPDSPTQNQLTPASSFSTGSLAMLGQSSSSLNSLTLSTTTTSSVPSQNSPVNTVSQLALSQAQESSEKRDKEKVKRAEIFFYEKKTSVFLLVFFNRISFFFLPDFLGRLVERTCRISSACSSSQTTTNRGRAKNSRSGKKARTITNYVTYRIGRTAKTQSYKSKIRSTSEV
jgi:hypothetical protein